MEGKFTIAMWMIMKFYAVISVAYANEVPILVL